MINKLRTHFKISQLWNQGIKLKIIFWEVKVLNLQNLLKIVFLKLLY